ncbi:MAG: type II toxin-antitoxin system VapB family antitoxin [Propionibacteriaceae bacterium]|jgi:hypothetical protein|nr:type II toxin-antitoxin system VapB family antitoxin [Propionibacteriaceae bacterium]
MAINLKNPAAVAAVQRLAESYQTDYGQAIVLAADETLAGRRDTAKVLQRVRQISAAYRAAADGRVPLDDADVYDDNGLPK